MVQTERKAAPLSAKAFSGGVGTLAENSGWAARFVLAEALGLLFSRNRQIPGLATGAVGHGCSQTTSNDQGSLSPPSF